ncbi:relaxase/mobilization nuclease domain-containing protein [Actinacidiphila acididurans]|uniref:relaxase/mobilization nuclease domain-containing protein n=1 Tax=Actinacidiphila acididurans TaxID=2784346 RepID=UPI001F48995F|nr:relaxase/mobilization nuclease domain-containing protein [Actinacidiphila acididurans]
MVPKIRRGSRTYGLLAYLYGPGRRDEHTDPHLIGSWDGFAPDPGRDPDAKAAMSQLAAALDLRVKQAGPAAPAEHVWHCSVRTDPGDRHLSDAEWNAVARRLVTAVGLTPDGDPDGCRWVAVRHADDHIHIVATMVRGDLRRPRMNYDFKKAQAECRHIEAELGLRRLRPGDGTAAKNPTSAERFKAERTGRTEAPRETLREAVRQALAGAADEPEFFARVHEAGLRIKLRTAPSGDTLGYSVALPGDRNREGEPVWFAGSTLAPDLSLPKIRRRFNSGAPAVDATRETVAPRAYAPDPAAQRRRATGIAEQAVTELTTGDDEAAGHLPGIGALLDAAAQTSAATTRAQLRKAARVFERATRSHVHAHQADNRALRAAARGIIHAGGALGRGEDGGATAMLLSTLVLAAIAAAHWHSARGHAQQAEAARQAATHLRAAYVQAAAAPLHALRQQGRALSEEKRRTYEAAIRSTIPATALPFRRPADLDALTATLAQAEQAGHDPVALLREAVAMRELATADNIEDVLVWRLRRLADLPAHPETDHRRAAPRPRTGLPQPPTAPRPPLTEPNRNSPRRR